MKRYVCGLVAVLASFGLGWSALACNVERYDPDVVDYADVVLVGAVSNYRVIPNEAMSESIRKSVEAGTAPLWQREKYYADLAKGVSPGGYYGKFDIAVEKVLRGKVGTRISATYRDWTYAPSDEQDSRLPDRLASQRYLIAFQKPDAESYVGRSTDSGLLTVYINHCIGPFLLEMPTWFVKGIEDYVAWKKARVESRLGKP